MTGPTDGYEAHVQVLTAEVRTLVVGSRQVTMSVYGQLDEVAPGEIEPFGRVCPKGDNQLFIHVVGRHAEAGDLVRSHVPRRPASLNEFGRVSMNLSPFPSVWDFQNSPTYPHWRLSGDADQQRRYLAGIAKQWAMMSLIVLAGLR